MQNPEIPQTDALELAPKEAFVIRDVRGLQWLTETVLRLRQRTKDFKAWVKETEAANKRDEERLLEHFGPQVREAVEQETRGKAKTLSVPSGRIGFRTTPQGFEVEDEEAYQAWCCENVPDACFTEAVAFLRGHRTFAPGKDAESRAEMASVPITVRHVVDKPRVLALYKQTGVLPDGCCFSGNSENLVISPNKDSKQETIEEDEEIK